MAGKEKRRPESSKAGDVLSDLELPEEEAADVKGGKGAAQPPSPVDD